MNCLLISIISNICTIFNDRSFATRTKKLKDIEKRLGLPEKPKRAATAYNRFFKETYATLKDLENKKPGLVAREISGLWKQCDAAKKQEYEDAFKKESVIFSFQRIE